MPLRSSLAQLFALGPLAVSILPSTHTQSSDGCSDNAEDYCTGDTKTCVAYFRNSCTSGSDRLSQEIAQCCTNPTRNYNPEQLFQCIEDMFGIDRSVSAASEFIQDVTTAAMSWLTAPSFLAAGATTAAASTSGLAASMSDDPYSQACNEVNSIFDHCETQTPSFTDISAFTSAAGCLCYSTQGVYPFDGWLISCLPYLSTVADSSDLSSLETFFNGSIPTSPCAA